MRATEAMRKALAILIAVCCVGIAGTAAAQGDKKVDCDKTPTHPECQAKK